eukprot:5280958-Amphidinium_carterae.1
METMLEPASYRCAVHKCTFCAQAGLLKMNWARCLTNLRTCEYLRTVSHMVTLAHTLIVRDVNTWVLPESKFSPCREVCATELPRESGAHRLYAMSVKVVSVKACRHAATGCIPS